MVLHYAYVGIKKSEQKNSKDLIVDCEFLINVSPELYDSSTIMLDALSLETPVIQFILNSPNPSFNTIDEPISIFFENNDIEEILLKSYEHC